MALYCLPRAKARHSLKEERTQYSPKPKVLVPSSMIVDELFLHACKHGSAPVKNNGIQALNCTMHMCTGGLMKCYRSHDLPNHEQYDSKTEASDLMYQHLEILLSQYHASQYILM
jgi:hypothetical protein